MVVSATSGSAFLFFRSCSDVFGLVCLWNLLSNLLQYVSATSGCTFLAFRCVWRVFQWQIRLQSYVSATSAKIFCVPITDELWWTFVQILSFNLCITFVTDSSVCKCMQTNFIVFCYKWRWFLVSFLSQMLVSANLHFKCSCKACLASRFERWTQHMPVLPGITIIVAHPRLAFTLTA